MSVAASPPGGPDLPEADAVRVAEFALSLLPEAERIAFAGRVARDPRLRAELALWEESLAPVADEVVPVLPPAAVKRRLEATLFPQQAESRDRRWPRVLPWSVAGLSSVAAAAVLLMALPLLRAPEPGPILVSELSTPGDELRVLAAYDPARGGFRVERTAGAAPAGRAVQLWAIGAAGVPVSLGLLADGLVPLPDALRDEVANLTLAISDEPAGGSPTGAPTGAILATGAVTSL